MAAAAASGVAAPAAAISKPLQEARVHDLLLCRTSSGAAELMEVMEGWDGSSAVVAWKGQLLKASAAVGGAARTWQLQPMGEPRLLGVAARQLAALLETWQQWSRTAGSTTRPPTAGAPQGPPRPPRVPPPGKRHRLSPADALCTCLRSGLRQQ